MPNKKSTADKMLTFQVKPRLLTLLGDQLIRDANLAVFELVKNAYDADATKCSVLLDHPDRPTQSRIVIEDDGTGMDERLLRDVWMVIATDFRLKQRGAHIRSPRFNRYPLGEKGLGRLSIHKLGRKITLVTRVAGGRELLVKFDWNAIESAQTFESAFVSLNVREPQIFTGTKHGTRIIVEDLREIWSRSEARKLHRAVNSLASPFKGPSDFEVSLKMNGPKEWFDGMFTSTDASGCAIYHVIGNFGGDSGSFTYTFTPPAGYSRQLSRRTEKVKVIRLEGRLDRRNAAIDLAQYGIGKVEFEFRLFDRDPAVLKALTGDVKGLKDYLDENGGVRIYRDGIRVYDFGEPGNDWLNLDIRRVNTPTARTSNNQILGVLRLDAVSSADLREKTNREGFIENQAFADFRAAVISVLTQVEAEKGKDQKRLREAIGKGTGKKVFEKLAEVREILERKGVLASVEPALKAAEKEMEIYRDQLLHAAVPGLTIGTMLHGAEKILDELRLATTRDSSSERIKDLVDRLYRAMRPITNLLKNPAPSRTTASTLIKEALFSAELRLKRHKITMVEISDEDAVDFRVRGSRQMLVASLTNLIDNSIHWLESKSPKEKIICIGATDQLDGGPAIVVADNGPGFGNDDPEDLVAAFFSRRVGGMGLGLYIVSEVMRVSHGQLIFPAPGDLDLPKRVNGAVVALQFTEAE